MAEMHEAFGRLKGRGVPSEKLVPPPPGILHDYQKKGVVGGAICMNVKTKEIGKLAHIGKSAGL